MAHVEHAFPSIDTDNYPCPERPLLVGTHTLIDPEHVQLLLNKEELRKL